MLVLNLLNRIFGEKPSLRRSDIDGYQENTDQQHEIEEQASSDDFDTDALEGFSETSLKTDVMHSLDEKMKATYGSGGTNWAKVIVLTSVIAACVVIAFVLLKPSNIEEQTLAFNTKEKHSKVNEKEVHDAVTTETTDDEVAEMETKQSLIGQDEVVVKAKETSPQRVKRPQPTVFSDETGVPAIQDQVPEMSQNEAENMEKLAFEPASSIPHNNNNNETLKYGQAKEFYMLDFKLVDYRAYREKPIKEVRMEASGTPAHMENDSDKRSEVLFEEKEVEISYVDYLKETLNYFQNKKYKKALQRFNTILKQYEDDVNANFYAGLSAYNLESYSQAEEYFKKAYSLQYGNFKEEANWFEALSLLKLNKKSKAKKLLQQIVAGNGFYSEHAKEKLADI